VWRRVTCRSAAWTLRIGGVGFEFQVDVKSSRQASLVDDVAAVGVKVFGKGIETGTKEVDHRNRPLGPLIMAAVCGPSAFASIVYLAERTHAGRPQLASRA